MARAIDICTCGRIRDDHDYMEHTFMPHPQPNTAERAEPDLREKVVAFLSTFGDVTSRSHDKFIARLPNGEVWQVEVFKRSSESPEGV